MSLLLSSPLSLSAYNQDFGQYEIQRLSLLRQLSSGMVQNTGVFTLMAGWVQYEIRVVTFPTEQKSASHKNQMIFQN